MKKTNAITKHVENISKRCRCETHLDNKLDTNPHANITIKYDDKYKQNMNIY